MNGNVRPADMERITTPELAEAFIEEQIREIKEQVGDGKVLLALSGGVDSSVVAAVIYELPCHQNATPDIDRECVVNHFLGDFLDCVKAVLVIHRRIVHQNVDSSVSFQNSRIDFLYRVFIGNVAFQNQAVGIHFLKSALNNASITRICSVISVWPVSVRLVIGKRLWHFLIYQNHFRPLAGKGQCRRRPDGNGGRPEKDRNGSRVSGFAREEQTVYAERPETL